MDGLARTRRTLRRQRAAGVPFSDAWQAALAELEPKRHPATHAAHEYDALVLTEPSWRAAYLGWPPPTGERRVQAPPDALTLQTTDPTRPATGRS